MRPLGERDSSSAKLRTRAGAREKEFMCAGKSCVCVLCSVYMKWVNPFGYVCAQLGVPLVFPECKQIFSFSLP